MGCCLSRPGRGEPYPANAPDASQRNINNPTPPSASAASSRSASQAVAENRPNVPLKPIGPAHRSRLPKTHDPRSPGGPPLKWTRQRLEKERNDWWDTRITASSQIWAALREMVQSLQNGQVSEAQVLLDATECTCPTGMLWKGVFDRRGEIYRVPEWIVIEPEGLVEVEDLKDEAGSVGEDDDKEADEESLGDEVSVRCRLSSTSQDYRVNIRRGERVASLVAKLKDAAGIEPGAVVKIVYGGRIIDYNKPLESHPHWNYDVTHVLIAMILTSVG